MLVIHLAARRLAGDADDAARLELVVVVIVEHEVVLGFAVSGAVDD
jgi:hypothetical protein